MALLAYSAAVRGEGGTYDRATGVLSPDYVTVGAAVFQGMQVTVSGIDSGPTGTIGQGWDYSYNTASNQLTVPTVVVGNARYYNLVARVGSLISPGLVMGADLFDGTFLTMPYVQTGTNGPVYANVVVTINRVLCVGGGMPKHPRDIYNHYPGGNDLSIAAVQYGGNIYTNVVVTLRSIVSVGSASPPPTLGPSPMNLVCGYNSCPRFLPQLVNTGGYDLHIGSIALDSSPGPDGTPVFWQTNNCPATLGAGQSCAFFVSRLRYASGQGTLTVTDDGAGSPRTVILSAPNTPH